MKRTINLLRFGVISGFHFEHPTMGIIVFERGEVFEQFIDDSTCFSNGLFTLTRNNIVYYQNKLKKLPDKKVKINNKCIDISKLKGKKLEEFKAYWSKYSKNNYCFLILKGEPTIFLIRGKRIPRKKKKQFYKTIK